MWKLTVVGWKAVEVVHTGCQVDIGDIGDIGDRRNICRQSCTVLPGLGLGDDHNHHCQQYNHNQRYHQVELYNGLIYHIIIYHKSYDHIIIIYII